MIKDIAFDIPSFKMALAQVFIGGADILMASLVLYFSLTPFVQIPFDVFIGVFEGLFMYIIPGEHNQALLFGALVAYRIIYYLFPLVISGIILVSYEGYLRYIKSRRLFEYMKEKKQKLICRREKL